MPHTLLDPRTTSFKHSTLNILPEAGKEVPSNLNYVPGTLTFELLCLNDRFCQVLGAMVFGTLKAL